MKKVLLFFCCLSITGTAQIATLQELVNRRQYAEVINQAGNPTKADSADYATMYAIGQAYEGLLKYTTAYGYYKYCLSMDTTNIDILNTLARMAINLGKATDAQRYFHKVLASDSTNFYANYQLGRLFQQLGEYERAIEKFEYLLTNDESNSVLLRNLGDCFTQTDRLQAAESCYHTAYQYNKENASLASVLINTMLRIGGESAKYALTVCDTALYYNPNNRQLERNKAMTLYMNKRYADADSLYTQLLTAGDSTFLTLKYAGVSRYYGGKYMNAIEPLEDVYTIDSTQVDVCLLLGSSLGKTYDRKQAHVFLDKAEKNMQPDPVYVRQLLKYRAETYRKDGKHAESDKLYYKAWQEEPENVDLLAHIATHYNASHINNYQNENSRQRGLFIRCLYVREALKTNKFKDEFYHYHRYFFESLYNDMFFRSVTEEPMLAPDGKKSNLSIVDLRTLINEMPEIPEKTKEKMDINQKRTEEFQQELQRKQAERAKQLEQQKQQK